MVSFLAGVASKENAILLPATLLLLEFPLFQDWSQPSVRRRFSYVLSSGLVHVADRRLAFFERKAGRAAEITAIACSPLGNGC